MKLLDKPIEKTAALSNKEAIIRMLAGTAAGAGAGALGELLLTGKLGWGGALAGGALGAGATAYFDDATREKLKSMVSGRKAAPEAPAAEKKQPYGTARQQFKNIEDEIRNASELTAKQKETYLADISAKRKAWEASRYRGVRAVNEMFKKDPAYRQFAQNDAVLNYAAAVKESTGKFPGVDDLKRYAKMGAEYDDQTELGIERQFLPQMIGGAALGKLSPAVAEKLSKTPGGMKVLERLAGKGTLSPKITGHTGQGIMNILKTPFGKGGKGVEIAGKLGTTGAATKAAAKFAPGLNVVLDAPELFLDPKTGEYNWNVGKNLANADRLMENREMGKMDLIGEDRNILYNIGAGGLRGWVNPVTTIGIAGKRLGDVGSEAIDWMGRDDSALEKQRREFQKKIKMRNKQ